MKIRLYIALAVIPLLATAAVAETRTAIHYAAGKNALLDLETPSGAGPFLAVVAVHGGGWSGGSRADAQPFCREMLRIGLACAAIDYRLAPSTRFPGQIDDLQTAIRFLMSKASAFHIKPLGVLLAGESAGGQIVSWLGSTHPAGLPILGVIAFSAPSDLAALGEPGRLLGVVPPEVHDLLGVERWTARDVASMQQASPLAVAQAGAPPFLLIHGEADRLVPVSQSRNFCNALLRSGSECELAAIPAARHGLWSEDQFEHWKPSWLPRVVGWLSAEKFLQK